MRRIPVGYKFDIWYVLVHSVVVETSKTRAARNEPIIPLVMPALSLPMPSDTVLGAGILPYLSHAKAFIRLYFEPKAKEWQETSLSLRRDEIREENYGVVRACRKIYPSE
jgi:hypothetical protein